MASVKTKGKRVAEYPKCVYVIWDAKFGATTRVSRPEAIVARKLFGGKLLRYVPAKGKK